MCVALLMVCVCVCGFVAGLMFVFVCVGVVMGLDRLIGVSWVCVLCVEPVLEVERERGIKMAVGKPRKMRLKTGWKEIIKKG